MKLSGETKFFAGVIVVTIILLIGAIALFSKPVKEVQVLGEKLVTETAWATGSATPKATLVEFSDFECPACGAVHPIIKQVIEQYKGDLKFVYRHYPLDQHKNARLAASAAEAAGAQGKFWEMHDLLFKNQTNLSQDAINGLAIELKLDMDKFTKEMTEGTYNQKIQKDVDEGTSLGINSTPTFFLNGKKLDLFNCADLKTKVETAINEAK